MELSYSNEPWAKDAYTAYEYLVDHMGRDNWIERRQKIVKYFQDQTKVGFTEKDILNGDMKMMFSPIAVYSDWIAWYMFLVECLIQRPSSGDAVQGARIFPFFSRIGKDLDSIKQITGIDKRIDELLSERDNHPDSSLFEILVANLYKTQGWDVQFIPENVGFKTPDFSISKGDAFFEVECKRMQKVPKYSEDERILWQNRSRHLVSLLKNINYSCYIDFNFKVPLEDTDERILITLFYMYLAKFGGGKVGTILSDQIDMAVKPIYIHKVNEILAKKDIKMFSPEMVQALIGKYQSGSNCSFATDFVEGSKLGIEDGLDVLNVFCSKISKAYVFKWESTSEYSIDKKARDVKHHIHKAFTQLSNSKDGIIHVGYETLDGPIVERRRFERIEKTVQNFDFKDKRVKAIYCHALQLLPEYENFNWAETNCYFQKDNAPTLENLMLFTPDVESKNDPHWEQDIRNRPGSM